MCLNRFIFDFPKAHDALLFMTILSTNLKALKRRGYNGSSNIFAVSRFWSFHSISEPYFGAEAIRKTDKRNQSGRWIHWNSLFKSSAHSRKNAHLSQFLYLDFGFDCCRSDLLYLQETLGVMGHSVQLSGFPGTLVRHGMKLSIRNLNYRDLIPVTPLDNIGMCQWNDSLQNQWETYYVVELTMTVIVTCRGSLRKWDWLVSNIYPLS